MEIVGYREFKPMKDTVEWTFFFVDQNGRKERIDFEIPLDMIGGDDFILNNDVLTMRNVNYEAGEKAINEYHNRWAKDGN